ncbi:MAG: hypothetical protein EZS28_033928, partial [Streblomastix strix]
MQEVFIPKRLETQLAKAFAIRMFGGCQDLSWLDEAMKDDEDEDDEDDEDDEEKDNVQQQNDDQYDQEYLDDDEEEDENDYYIDQQEDDVEQDGDNEQLLSNQNKLQKEKEKIRNYKSCSLVFHSLGSITLTLLTPQLFNDIDMNAYQKMFSSIERELLTLHQHIYSILSQITLKEAGIASVPLSEQYQVEEMLIHNMINQQNFIQ